MWTTNIFIYLFFSKIKIKNKKWEALLISVPTNWMLPDMFWLKKVILYICCLNTKSLFNQLNYLTFSVQFCFLFPDLHHLISTAHSPPTATYITPRNLVCSWTLDKQAALRLSLTQARVRMELTKILMEMQPNSLPPFHQLLALVCLVTAIYKVTTILVKRNKMLRHFKAFPGPPGHWFFGHSLRVFWRIYVH